MSELLTGCSYFGAETGTYVPHGLWARNWEDMLDQMQVCGFNAVRLSYSNDIFLPDKRPSGIDFTLNPDLEGKTPEEIFDIIIGGLTSRGLKVLLDRHRPDAQGQSELWFTDHVSEAVWISDWLKLADRHKGNPLVIGADLHNEPHGRATWDSGDPATDWKAAAQRCGNAILGVAPDWLIVVEGVESYDNDWTWWGGQLRQAKDHPVELSDPTRLVYSPHEYGPVVWDQSWFHDPSFPANMAERWRERWGYLVEEGVTPVLVGEVGAKDVVGPSLEATWIKEFFSYIREHEISYMWWSWNPNSGDTGGILNDDWLTVNQTKMDLIRTHLAT